MMFRRIPEPSGYEVKLERIMIKAFTKLNLKSSNHKVSRFFKLRNVYIKLKSKRIWENNNSIILPLEVYSG